MIKNMLSGALLLTTSSLAIAVAPGGPSCGWGNLLFEGSSGHARHLFAYTTNGTFNQTFGMTSGTNGCSVNGTLSYGGKAMVSSIMEEFSEDVAQGQGDAVNAVAVSMGVEKNDRLHFAKVMHDNFSTLFPSADVTSDEVYESVISVMQGDETLSKYAS